MYLEKRTDVKNWGNTESKDKFKITVRRGNKLVEHIKGERISQIVEEVGYWRKANAIHQWFVDNIQDGVDDSKSYYADVEKLKELLELVNKVLKASKLVEGKIQNGSESKGGKMVPIMVDGKYIEDPSVAKELLPTQEGFFFGSTDYNEYYIQDLKNTKEILEEALADDIGCEYYYQSSW